MELTATIDAENWWSPEWKDGSVAIPLSIKQLEALQEIVWQWCQAVQDETGEPAINCLDEHKPGVVESTLNIVAAAMRSRPASH